MNGPILRAAVVRLTGAPWFRRLVTGTPIGQAVASRFIAGDHLDDAIAAARSLREQGLGAVLDHLGENVRAPEQASQATSDYVRALDRVAAEPDVDAYISVKLTQLGLDFSNDLCISNLERVLVAAEGRLVMIDMEGSAYVDRTLTVFRELRGRHENVGVCLQAYLRRTPSDIDVLPERSAIRLVKGAYLEPPEVALDDRGEVDRAFARQFATLIARGHIVHVATHDPRLLQGARRYVERAAGDATSRVEYQMLYGVRRDIQARLAADGLPVRVYVPYGTESYAYLTRRLAERPANMWFFLSNLVRVRT